MNPADITLIANIGEIIAAVLVVVSLGYVALQICQNTHALKITAAQTYVSMYNTITSELGKPDLAVIWHNGPQDYSGLDRGKSVQFSAVAGQLVRANCAETGNSLVSKMGRGKIGTDRLILRGLSMSVCADSRPLQIEQ